MEVHKTLVIELSVLAALATFCTEYVIYVVIVFISFIAFMLHIAMANALGLPVLTMPFNLSALIFLFGMH